MKPLALLLGLLLTQGTAAWPQGPASSFISQTPALAPPPGLAQALAGLRPEPLAAHIAYLTAPQRQGRGLGTAGLAAAAEDLALRLARAGLAPLGRSYFQRVPLREVRATGGSLSLAWPGQRVTWQHGRTCLLPELAPQTFSAPVLFVGYGIQESALGHDDFQGLEVRGKVVVLVGGLPPLPAWQSPELRARYGSAKPQERYAARLEVLDRLGAKAVVAIEPGLAQELAGRRPQPQPFYRPAAGVPYTDEPPLIRVSAAAAAPLLAELGVQLDQPGSVTPRPWPQANAQLRATGSVRPAASRNLLAVLPGSDPSLRDQAVLIGAHLDHLGMPQGVLHPGADDNASGVAALTELAKVLASLEQRPRRTLIFAFWTGEEDGKFGSGHYVRHPQWPLARTAAYLNLDMIGHPWSDAELRKLVLATEPGRAEAFLAGLDPAQFAEPGYAEHSPHLGQALAQAGPMAGLALHLDPGDGRNGGSDYRDFARAGVPWVRFFGNYFPGYHEPSDTADQLDPVQVQRMAKLALATAWLLAER